jgi:leader peptidase (prepilin peptidase)/N-methyltransferase
MLRRVARFAGRGSARFAAANGAARRGIAVFIRAAGRRRWSFRFMATVFEVGAALLGACVGSFLNVVIWRLQQDDPAQRSLGGRSHCPHCGTAIRWFFNVPVLGWLVLRGKANCCGKPIAIRYPLVELLTAGLFYALAVWSPVAAACANDAAGMPIGAAAWALFAALATFVSLLVALSFIDLDTQLLPDVLTKPGIVIGLLAGIWPGVAGVLVDDRSAPLALRTLLASLVGMLAGGGITWGIRAVGSWLFRREAMGFGDVKLMAMVGAFLGWQSALLTMFLGCIYGAAIGGIGAAFGGATKIPFGPYLALGAITALFAREPIVTFLITTWPEWQRDDAKAPWLLAGFAAVSLVLLFVLVRRGRRSG